MKLPRDLSGDALIRALCRDWGYRMVHQEGSHVALQTETPAHQRVVVPRHASLRIGTLAAILRSVAVHKGVNRDRLLQSITKG